MGVFTALARTWGATEVVTATNLNAQLRDLINGFGAKTAYTPTLGGFTQGAGGVMSGSYTQVGKWVWFEASFVFGTGSAAAAAIPTCSLPVTANANSVNTGLARAQFIDAGVNSYLAAGRILSTTTAAAYILGTSGVFTTPSTTTPFTWGTGDGIYWSGIYEAA